MISAICEEWCNLRTYRLSVVVEPIQALFQVERPAGLAVGEGQRGNQGGEAEVACRRPPGGREVQPGGARLPAGYLCRLPAGYLRRLPVGYLRWTRGSPGWNSEEEEVRARRRRRGRWSVRSSDPQAPGVFFLYFPWCLTYCVVVLGCCAGFYCLAEGGSLPFGAGRQRGKG